MISLTEAKSWTPVTLFQSGVRVNPKTRHTPKPSGNIILKNVVPYVGMKSLLLQFLHKGISLPMMYQVDLFFSGVEFFQTPEEATEARVSSNDLVKVQYKELKTHLRKIRIDTNLVRYRCSCPDCYFTYAWWAFRDGALFGPRPKPYIRKTTWAPKRNPGEYSGLCKHGSNSIVLAQKIGWIDSNKRLF
jgi:hypothetical protein